MARQTTVLSLAAVSVLALTGAAQAQTLDAEAFVDRFEALYELLGYQMDFGPARAEGDSVIVDGVTIAIEEMDPVTLEEELTFSGVAALADGAYSAETLVIPTLSGETTSEDGTVNAYTLEGVTLGGIYLPGGELTFADSLVTLETLSTGPLRITENGAEIATVASISASSTFNPPPAEGELIDVASTVTVDGISVDLSGIEGSEVKQTIKTLGTSRIEGSIDYSMSWGMEDGRMTIDRFLFDFPELGSLDLTFDVAGMTPDLLDRLNQMNEAVLAAQESGDAAAAEQQEMAMGLEMLQATTFHGAAIRYEDASLADKLIEANAAAQGVDRATYVTGLEQAVEVMLGDSPMVALNEQITAAVSTFLADPQSFEIAAAPASPMTALVITGAAAANPGGIVDLLGVTVTANE